MITTIIQPKATNHKYIGRAETWPKALAAATNPFLDEPTTDAVQVVLELSALVMTLQACSYEGERIAMTENSHMVVTIIPDAQS